MSAHPRSLTLFTSLHALANFHSVPQQLFPAIKIIVLSHGATKLILKVKFLENTLSVRVVLIGTVILSVGSGHVRDICWVLRLVRQLLFLPFSDLSLIIMLTL